MSTNFKDDLGGAWMVVFTLTVVLAAFWAMVTLLPAPSKDSITKYSVYMEDAVRIIPAPTTNYI